MNKQYFVRKIWDTIHYITVLYRNDTIHYTYCIVPTLPGGGKSGKAIAQANIQLELPAFDPKNVPEWAEEFAEFLLLTGQSHVDVATKCSLLKRSRKKKFWQKQVKPIVKTCSTWAEVLQRLEKTFPVYETDLSVCTQIEEPPMLPEVPSAARVSEYVCDLVYLFSRMNVGSRVGKDGVYIRVTYIYAYCIARIQYSTRLLGGPLTGARRACRRRE